jgi:leucyl aminopeptidase (aminopeptidase T)
MSDTELRTAARKAIIDCLAVKKGETILIVTDIPRKSIGNVFYEVAAELGFEAMLTVMEARKSHGDDPPQPIVEAMAAASVVIAPTITSLTHTAARRKACEAGARVATMPGILPETLIRGANADYNKIAERTKRIADLLTEAEVATLRSPSGTNITMPIEGIKAIASTGLICEPGQWGNLPSGEAYLMPVEGASEGVVVVDGSFAGIGLLEEGETITLRIKDGFATSIEGGAAAKKLQEILEPHGKAGRNLAELGVGTNDAAKVIGAILEDEKVAGTAHVALGNNVSMGGTFDPKVHLDGIIFKPDLELDGKPILVRGKLQI